jgi:alanyl-tRNA synthetase
MANTKPHTVHEVRKAFLDFFAENEHLVVPSSPITPKDDPTLLFINAGMAPLKDYFAGSRTPPQARLTSSQKCVRAGGKHNDLDNVGYTARHHTFFEMLGNFSFGEYFKRGAIEFAWRFLTERLGLPASQLLVTVFHEDDEAAQLWRDIAGLDDDRIIRIATDDNFWSMGDTGPCGPCSEIFFDHGEQIEGGPPGSPDEDGDRFVEIWNLVFMQFDKQADGELKPLPKPCIDTGSGLERLAAAVQGVTANYDTDLFRHLVTASEQLTGNTDPAHMASHRVIADHTRTCAFLVAEGVLPSNEGRGYVLRRIMRRALRHLHLLGATEPQFAKMVAPLVEVMGEHYQELRSEQARIEHAFAAEEEQFRATLDRGMKILEKEVAQTPRGGVFAGDVAFKLYDTYGFPLDLTEDVLRAHDLTVDEDGFNTQMAEQRARARKAWSGSGDVKGDPVWKAVAEAVAPTRFTGYDSLAGTGTVTAMVVDGQSVDVLEAGTEGAIVFDQTPFYGESGGQVGDTGTLSGAAVHFAVSDTQKPVADLHAHIGKLREGQIKVGDSLSQTVDDSARRLAAANHSGTHLLNAALREVLGPHVVQKGSYVGPDRLRFDFAHGNPVTRDELDRIEAMVNAQVLGNGETQTQLMALDDALASGAQAMFGEKYDEQVRVLSMGGVRQAPHEEFAGELKDGVRQEPHEEFAGELKDSVRQAPFSVELCGGTHVARMGDIGLFKILSEASVGAGVRRIEAVTNEGALQVVREQEQLLTQLSETARSSRDRLLDDVEKLVSERKRLLGEIKTLKEGDALGQLGQQDPEQIGAQRFLGAAVAGLGGRELKDLVRKMLDDNRADVICLISETDKNAGVVVGVGKALSSALPAKTLLTAAVDALGGGGGGGSPTLAQGATKGPLADAALKDQALANVRQAIGS